MKFEPINPQLFEAFVWTHLGNELTHPITWWHRELIKDMTYSRIAIAAPRGFAKSSYYSFFYPLYLALERPGVSIQLISATGALAEFWLSRIKTQLDTNPTIIDFYGKQEGIKWSNDDIRLANGSVIMAKGAEKQIRGFRPDVVICDDLETDEMVISKDRRHKFDHWFWTDLIGLILSHGQIIVVGTILHPDSFLSQLVNKGKSKWNCKLYKAIKDDGTALWPDQWPLDVLNERRAEMGHFAFNQEYMNDPIPDEARTFQEKWFKYYTDRPDNCVYFTTVDPAIEIGDVNDFTAIVTCAIDSDENVYVVEVINRRMLPSETVDAIFDVYHRWKSSSIVIETQGFQKMLKYDIDREKKRRQEFPVIVEGKAGGRRKELRIQALQPWFEAGKVFMKESQEDLKIQLLRFPSTQQHDDIIDALAYQLDVIRPALKQVTRINPDSFMALIERRRERRKMGQETVWGNQAIRNPRNN